MTNQNCNSFFDFKQSLEDIIASQSKLIGSVQTMIEVRDDESNQTPREAVYKDDKLVLYHYKKQAKEVSKVPTLIIYALVNTPAMMDISQDKSFIKKLLEDGMDLYLIEWGFPTADDKFITLDDYINDYIDGCVDYILESTKSKTLNILGVCQGGTLSVIYTALHSEKVKNLITMVTPIDFSTNDGLLFKWGKHINADELVNAYGVVPGEVMNTGFLTLKPLSLMVNKYMDLIDDLDNVDSMTSFMTMEKWIFNSPGQAGEAFRQFINDLYHNNKLIQGTMKIGDKTVDLKKIKQPLLNVYAEKDNQVPNAASEPLGNYVSSKDVTTKCFPTGHIGMFVSGRSQKEVAPTISKWAKEHSK
ncbi:MAG: class III poly(R)-hydroxyalkanoic acid synthase subunit PhaC [Bacillota bacterium]|nr:class III poly(R)-hydroxyalkanoic acid synthase subunit PhaC [Bacillota bacterium]